jgi:predicted nucleotidyltransferase
MKENTIIVLLRQHKEMLRERYGVVSLGCFGSFARGRETSESDVDIAVQVIPEKKNLHNFLALKRELENLLGRRVDLGIETALKPAARELIAKEILYV